MIISARLTSIFRSLAAPASLLRLLTCLALTFTILSSSFRFGFASVSPSTIESSAMQFDACFKFSRRDALKVGVAATGAVLGDNANGQRPTFEEVPGYLQQYAKQYADDPRAAARSWFADAKYGLCEVWPIYALWALQPTGARRMGDAPRKDRHSREGDRRNGARQTMRLRTSALRPGKNLIHDESPVFRAHGFNQNQTCCFQRSDAVGSFKRYINPTGSAEVQWQRTCREMSQCSVAKRINDGTDPNASSI